MTYNTVIIDGYQYLEDDTGRTIMILGDDLTPLKEDVTVRRWVKMGPDDYILFQPLASAFH